jgi:peroxiredoxin
MTSPTRRSFLYGLTGVGLLAARGASEAIAATQQTTPDPLLNPPANLPVPVDDGACRHLSGLAVPAVKLRSTKDRWVDLSAPSPSRLVVYCYPRTGRPGQAISKSWDDIPGARGCTPETCAFRDHHKDLQKLGAEVYGFSTQDTDYQKEMVERLKVPFEVLSDADFAFVRALRLPTFDFEGVTLVKRLTLVISRQHIEKVFYPVFPTDKHATEVMDWLREHPQRG